MAGKVIIPNWLYGFLHQRDVDRIEEAVRRAESKTSAEIIPMIVRRSSAIGHLPFMIFALLGFATLLLLWPFYEWVDSHGGDYWLPLMIAGFLAVSFPLAKLHRVQRILIPDSDEMAQAQQRAWAEFAATRLSAKRDRRGVLLFVSMMERKAVLLVDEGLRGVWTQDELEGHAVEFGRRLHDLPWGQAFEETIDELAEKLANAMPREANSRDEFPNHLRIKS